MEGSSRDRAPARPLIFLIDDNVPIGRLITLILRSGGFDVLCAESGEEAMAILADETPSVILCDLQLPGIDGFEVLRRIRDSASLEGIPVIAFTGLSLADDVSRIVEAGFDGHIVKPVDADVLIERVSSFLID